MSCSIRHEVEKKGGDTPDDDAEFLVTHSPQRGMNMSVAHGRDVNYSLLSHETGASLQKIEIGLSRSRNVGNLLDLIFNPLAVISFTSRNE